MSTVISGPFPPALVSVLPSDWTAADMQQHLGGIPLDRIRIVPPPGTATPEDVETVRRQTGRICELVDGTLVEKAVGYFESRLAVVLAFYLEQFLEDHDLGITLGEAGTLKILSGLVRAADVAFIGWDRLPGRVLPAEPVPALVPDLAVEVLSRGNTAAEMERKLREYFMAGVRLVWFIDAKTRTARAFTAVDQSIFIDQNGILSGGEVLPEFKLPLNDLFVRAERREPHDPSSGGLDKFRPD
jgi:Uma2 family endonuclease